MIKYYNSWVDRDKEQIVFITEIMSSGSLKDYLRKNPLIRWHAVKVPASHTHTPQPPQH